MKEGDFALVDFTGKAEGKVFETTSAEEAKKAGLYDANENRVFKPVLIVAGKKMLVPGLDDAILKADASGGAQTITLTPEQAFGQRNAELVRLIPSSKFKEQDIDPAPGMAMDIDGMPARVVGVEGGRVRVDFNHPMAGQTVEYSFKVNKVFSDAPSKMQALAESLFAGTSVSAKLDGTGGAARFSVPSSVRKDADFMQQKFRAIEFLLAFVPEVKKVVFEEEYAVENAPRQQAPEA